MLLKLEEMFSPYSEVNSIFSKSKNFIFNILDSPEQQLEEINEGLELEIENDKSNKENITPKKIKREEVKSASHTPSPTKPNQDLTESAEATEFDEKYHAFKSKQRIDQL